ncbi:hypothetical protein K2173_015720 [Erythroxylum novogranatense]|uniref:CRC domain-containing protein n=1 Tax=Erythroxylum novogranatense TaxID=1862640 RepID=A0AAV8TGG3_9ROSI|nr:hypothetical protein K2173_015720 [Erythroxylum novogranatense]
MDTPEKTTQIATPLSKFEDSPVFNYINNLSPIKPVKSVHVAQTFHSLSFASLPSIFTSPHVSSHKESRFVIRNIHSDPAKLEPLSNNGNQVTNNDGAIVDASQHNSNSTEVQENFNSGVPVGDTSVEALDEHLNFAIELPQTLKYDCGSPDGDSTPFCGNPNDCEVSREASSGEEVQFQGTCQAEQKKDATVCDWDNLISDAADLLIFNSPMDTEGYKGLVQKSQDQSVEFCASHGEIHGVRMGHPIVSYEKDEIEGAFTQPGETIRAKEINQAQGEYPANGNANMILPGNQSEKMDEVEMSFPCKVVSNLQRGFRRRCLDFEMIGARRKNLGDGSSTMSSILQQPDENNVTKDKKLVSLRLGGDSSRHILPGIGLHLNALALTSKDGKKIKHETLSSGISLSSSTASFQSPSNVNEITESLTSAAAEKDVNPIENDFTLAEDVPGESAYLVNEELVQTSPKKKRRRLEGEPEACKRCNCKKSKCLKLYCECFAAGVYCIEPCSCQDCYNKPMHEDTVLATRKQIESRNPLAFAPKVIRSSESVPEAGDDSSKTPASARHKRGCNCKKSNCLKKYCECYQGGVGCSINCRCEGCKNAFGRKDGSVLMEDLEAEDETEAHENGEIDRSSQKTEIQNKEEQNPNSTLPTTPLGLCRPLVHLSLPSHIKPPRSLLGIGSSSGLYAGQKYGKPNIFRSQAKFDKQSEPLADDNMPDILLQGSYSPSTAIKSSSPNSKRISPPHSNNLLGSSPGRRSGRKLILQSIPSFPSLTPQH